MWIEGQDNYFFENKNIPKKINSDILTSQEKSDFSESQEKEKKDVFLEANIKRYSLLADFIENKIKETNELKKKETWIVAGIWDFIGEKTWAYETGKGTYENIIKQSVNQAKELHSKIIAEFEWKDASEEQKQQISIINTKLEKILWAKLEDVSWGKAVFNTLWVDENAESTILSQWVRWAIWVAEGTFEWTVNIITWTLDLTKFLAKYAKSSFGDNPEYKNKIDEQMSLIYSFIKKEWMSGLWSKIYDIIWKEWDKILALPYDEQSEEIWKFAWNVISALLVIKWGIRVVDKASKLSKKTNQAERILTKLSDAGKSGSKRADKVAKLGEQANRAKNAFIVADKFLNGPAESLIWATLALSLNKTLVLLKTVWISPVEKIASIKGTIAEMQQAISKEKDVLIKNNIWKAQELLENEENKLKNVLENAGLWDTQRLNLAEKLLWKKLTDEQFKAILYLHNDISKGVYMNWHKELRLMVEELDKVWISRNEVRILMENWVLGKIMDRKSMLKNILEKWDLNEKIILLKTASPEEISFVLNQGYDLWDDFSPKFESTLWQIIKIYDDNLINFSGVYNDIQSILRQAEGLSPEENIILNWLIDRMSIIWKTTNFKNKFQEISNFNQVQQLIRDLPESVKWPDILDVFEQSIEKLSSSVDNQKGCIDTINTFSMKFPALKNESAILIIKHTEPSLWKEGSIFLDGNINFSVKGNEFKAILIQIAEKNPEKYKKIMWEGNPWDLYMLSWLKEQDKAIKKFNKLDFQENFVRWPTLEEASIKLWKPTSEISRKQLSALTDYERLKVLLGEQEDVKYLSTAEITSLVWNSNIDRFFALSLPNLKEFAKNDIWLQEQLNRLISRYNRD